MKIQLLSVIGVILVGCSSVPQLGSTQGKSDVESDRQSGLQTSPQGDAQIDKQSEKSSSETPSQSPEGNNVLELPPPTTNSQTDSQSPEVALAAYLKQTGAVLYDAENCAFCKRQARFFGPAAFQQLNVVNCGSLSNPSPECRRIGIRIFPTWDIGGKRYPTILPLQELAEISGFNRSSNSSAPDSQRGSL
jgi:hypothetical protein